MSDRNAYIKKMQAKLDEWNADIAKLEAKADGAEADMKIKYNQKVDVLKKHREKATTKLMEVRNASEEAWDDIKAGMENARDSIDNAVKSALSKFK